MTSSVKRFLLVLSAAAFLIFAGCSQLLSPNKTAVSVAFENHARFTAADVTEITVSLTKKGTQIPLKTENCRPEGSVTFSDIESGEYIVYAAILLNNEITGEASEEITAEEGKETAVSLKIILKKDEDSGETPETPELPEAGLSTYTATSFTLLKGIIENCITSEKSTTIILAGTENWDQTDSITVTDTVLLSSLNEVTIKRTEACADKPVFLIESKGNLTITGTTNNSIILDGNSSKVTSTKPLIECYGNLNLGNYCILQNNHNATAKGSGTYGGAVYCSIREDKVLDTSINNTLFITGGIIKNCSAAYRGGAVNIEGKASSDNTALKTFALIMSSGEITGNYTVSNQNGGAFALSGCIAQFVGGTITENTAGGDGGAIYLSSIFGVDGEYTTPVSNTSVTVMQADRETPVVISDNTAAQHGGGIYVNSGTLNYFAGSIENNTCSAGDENGNNIYVGTNNCMYKINAIPQDNSSPIIK